LRRPSCQTLGRTGTRPKPTMEASAFLEPLQPYLEAFAEIDPGRRAELLARGLTPDAEIWGPKRVFRGYAEISEKIDGFHKNWPGCRLVLASGLNSFHMAARFGNAIVNAGALSWPAVTPSWSSGMMVAFVESFPSGRLYRLFRNLGQRTWLWQPSGVPQVRPNPSIEGTSTSKLRLLAAAPHVKR